MIRIVIVDDEVHVVELVKNLIHYDALGVELAGTATSYEDALTLIRETEPEIIISDIKLPRHSGLDLVDEVSRMNIGSSFILISGHKNFEYAHDALKRNVRDYILKPINEDELNSAIKKLIEEIASARAREKKDLELTTTLDRSQGTLARAFVDRLLDGKQDAGDVSEANASYMLSLSDGIFQVLIIRVDIGKRNMHRISPEPLNERILTAYGTQLDPLCHFHAAATPRGNDFIVFLNYPKERDQAIAACIRAMQRNITNIASTFSDSAVTISVGIPVEALGRVQWSYQSAVLANYARLFLGNNRIIQAEDLTDQNALISSVLTSAHDVRLHNAIETFDAASYTILIDELFAPETLRSVHPAMSMLLARHVCQLFASLRREWEIELPDENAQAAGLDAYIDLASDYIELRDLLKTSVTEILQYNFSKRSERGKESILQARQYIDQHFAEPLSLETVADAIHLSPSYFSTLFNKQVGEGFVDYLTRTRMEKAKELLRTTSDPISIIAERVGIPDQKYFSKLFMKTIKLKPSAYRKLYR